MDQLFFGFGHDERYLREYFSQASGLEVDLTMTDNTSRMLSVKHEEGRARLRLHRAFLGAGPEVLREVAAFIGGKRRGAKRKTALINVFLKEVSSSIPPPPEAARKVRINTAGRHYDLKPVFDSLNGEYFGGEINAAITWGTAARARARRRTLGSYAFHTGIIRITPLLDSPAVPLFFLEFVVYHEMLHAAVRVEGSGKRRSIHSKEFKRRERAFREYDRARHWELGELGKMGKRGFSAPAPGADKAYR